MQLEPGLALVSNFVQNKGGCLASANGSSFLMNTSSHDVITQWLTGREETQAEKCFAWRGPPLLAVGKDFAGSPAANALQPPQWSHFSPHCSGCHHKAFLDLKGWKQQVRLRLCHACYSQDDEGPRVKIIKRKLEVSLQEWTRLCRWLLIELLNAIFTCFT